MKTFFLIACLVTALLLQSAHAQTNPVPADVAAMLSSISNQTYKLEAQVKAVREKRDAQDERAQLERSAGKMTDVEFRKSEWDRHIKAEKDTNELKQKIGVLKLREADIRKAYKIPEPSKAKKTTKPKP